MEDHGERERRAAPESPPRRAFIAKAAVGLSGLVAGVAGCRRPERTVDHEADSELAALRRVDPRLVKFRETRRIQTRLDEPRGIASDPNGGLYAVGDRQIVALGGMGGTWTLEGEPTCLAVTADNTFYTGIGDHVEVYDRAGRRVGSWAPPSPRAVITAIAADEDGIWVADSGGREVLRYDPAGRILARFGGKEPENGYPGLVVPSPHLDVAGAPGGGVFVSNPGMHRVEHHDAKGTLLSSWGEPSSDVDGFCGCCNPTDFAVFRDGRFVTAEKGIPRVKVYSAEGRFLAVVAGPDAFPSTTMSLDVAVSPDNRHVWVLEPKERVVRIFSPTEGAAA